MRRCTRELAFASETPGLARTGRGALSGAMAAEPYDLNVTILVACTGISGDRWPQYGFVRSLHLKLVLIARLDPLLPNPVTGRCQGGVERLDHVGRVECDPPAQSGAQGRGSPGFTLWHSSAFSYSRSQHDCRRTIRRSCHDQPSREVTGSELGRVTISKLMTSTWS
jgi:hypothetical protein